MVATLATEPAIRDPITSVTVLKLSADPRGKVEKRRESNLPLEYQYELIVEGKNIVGATIPWFLSSADGIIRSGQIWQIPDDGCHAKPLNKTEEIRFMRGTRIPIVLFGSLSISLEGFLRGILEEGFAYDRG